jgi:hypothetical protein
MVPNSTKLEPVARSTKPKGLIVKDIISGVALFGRRRKIAIASAFFKAIVVEIIDFSTFEITDSIFVTFVIIFTKN